MMVELMNHNQISPEHVHVLRGTRWQTPGSPNSLMARPASGARRCCSSRGIVSGHNAEVATHLRLCGAVR